MDSFSRGPTFGPRFTSAKSIENEDYTKLCTLFRGMDIPQQPVILNTNERNRPIEAIENGLLELVSISDGWVDDWFTFQQPSGTWYGAGMQSFIDSLRAARSNALNSTSVESEDGYGQFVLKRFNEEYMLLTVETRECSTGWFRTQIAFITDGHPLRGRSYVNQAEMFGLNGVTAGKDQSLVETEIMLDEDVTLEVKDLITEPVAGADEPMACGLVVENPLQPHGEFEWSAPDSRNYGLEDGVYPKYRCNSLLSPDFVCVWLEDHHPVSTEQSYRLDSVLTQDLTPLFDGRGPTNVRMIAVPTDR